MPAPTSVVYFDSTDTGAPSLNNAAGSLIGVLDACLINGYNLKTIQAINVSAGVATVSCSGHGLPNDSVNLIAGVTDKTALNGRRRVTVIDANTFTFDATGVPNGAAAGTMSVKRAPLGWAKQFANGTTKAVYARTDPQATAMVLRIDDTGMGDSAPVSGRAFARARMFEAMTSVDDGTGQSFSGGSYWQKGDAGSSTPKRWVLVGDSRTLYFFSEGASSFTSYGALLGAVFGDIRPYRAGDPYSCIITGPHSPGNSDSYGVFGSWSSAAGDPSTAGWFQIARMSNGFGAAVYAGLIGPVGTIAPGSFGAYPSPVDNGMVIVPTIFVSETNPTFPGAIRGEVRGAAFPMASCRALSLRILKDLVGTDRDYLVVPAGNSSVDNRGVILIDVSGPWG